MLALLRRDFGHRLADLATKGSDLHSTTLACPLPGAGAGACSCSAWAGGKGAGSEKTFSTRASSSRCPRLGPDLTGSLP
jgi:hypothetical protein